MQLRDDKLQIPYLEFGISLSGPSLFQLFLFYTIMTRYNALLRYDKFGKKIHTQMLLTFTPMMYSSVTQMTHRFKHCKKQIITPPSNMTSHFNKLPSSPQN